MKKELQDRRIKTRHVSVKTYFLTYLVLSVLSAGQWLIYSEYVDFNIMPIEYIFGIFCLGIGGLFRRPLCLSLIFR